MCAYFTSPESSMTNCVFVVREKITYDAVPQKNQKHDTRPFAIVHNGDFFLAYKTHMYNIQREFRQLKERADEEILKTRRDSKIQSLENIRCKNDLTSP